MIFITGRASQPAVFLTAQIGFPTPPPTRWSFSSALPTFFRKYRRWKAFYFWHKYIRRTTINQYKEFLEDNLFVLNKDLCPNLIKVDPAAFLGAQRERSFKTVSKLQPKTGPQVP